MRVIRIDAQSVRPNDLVPVVSWLREGGLVVFPTDTVYGLTADPGNAAAVASIFDVKGRPARLALPFIGASRDQVESACGPLAGAAARLADRWWPGPLSLVLPSPADVVPAARGADGSVAVRVPDHALARALAEAFGRLLPGTSANLSGEPPVSSSAALGAIARDVRVLVLDGGVSPGGLPSTIVDVRGSAPTLVRDGAISWARVLGSIDR